MFHQLCEYIAEDDSMGTELYNVSGLLFSNLFKSRFKSIKIVAYQNLFLNNFISFFSSESEIKITPNKMSQILGTDVHSFKGMQVVPNPTFVLATIFFLFFFFCLGHKI